MITTPWMWITCAGRLPYGTAESRASIAEKMPVCAPISSRSSWSIAAVSGSRRMHAVLKARGIQCSCKRVVRLMQTLGLEAVTKRRRKPTTRSTPYARFAPKHLNREFAASFPTRSGSPILKRSKRRRAGSRLSAILDLFSRMVVGWAMAATEDEHLVELARLLALVNRHTPAGLLHHCDRGSEFTSDRDPPVLREAGIEVSMSRTGDCYDNAAMEAFFATLTKECTDRVRFQTRQEARSAIFEYLEYFYHPVRLHST